MWRLRQLALKLYNFCRPERAERELTKAGAHQGGRSPSRCPRGRVPAARRSFGGVEQAKERSREERSFLWLEDARRDVRHAVRMLTRTPAFAVVAMFTLALGIGGATAIFSVVNAVLLQPLPYPEPERIVHVWRDDGRGSQPVFSAISDFLFDAWSDESETLEQLAAHVESTWTIRVGNRLERVRMGQVTPSLFPLLRAVPQHGRLILPHEADRGSAPVVLLSHQFWRDWFGSDPDTVGRTIHLETEPYTIVGVLPPDFSFPDRETLLWTPLDTTRPVPEVMFLLPTIARLRQGVTIEQAEAEGTALRLSLSSVGFELHTGPPRIRVTPLHEEIVASTRPALLVLFAGVLVLLLLACVNLANLLVARGIARERELSVRAAVGASRGRLVRQLLAESTVLGVVGGALGVLAAWWGHDLLVAQLPATIPRIGEASMDVTVLAFGLGLSCATGLACGTLPAVLSRRVDLVGGLAGHPTRWRGVGTRIHPAQMRATLAGVEIALAVVLVTAAGLLIRIQHAPEREPRL